MASRYGYQYLNVINKPRGTSIQGRVMIGTGGMLDASTASGTQFGTNSVGPPSGWQGAYSGCIGLLHAGVAGVVRTATGTYQVQLEDGWQKPVHSLDVTYLSGVTGYAGASGLVGCHVANMNVGPFAGGPTSSNPSQVTIVFFSVTSGLLIDPPSGAGFMIDLTLFDSNSGVQ